MKYYLTHGATPNYLDPKKKKALRLKSSQYQLLEGILCIQNYDGVFLRCLEKRDVGKVLSELHDGLAKGHYDGDNVAHKILRGGYYWPSLLKYSHAYVTRCQECQKSKGREKKVAFPLQPMIVERPFQQWGLDVIREINPNSSQLHKYILTSTDYFTRWSEEITLKTIKTSFLQSHIITRFGVPDSLVFDNEKYISSLKLTGFSFERNIKVKYSTNYYTQGNGLEKSTNKNLINILKKTVNDHQRNWHLALKNTLWDD
jgi:hypothetical protein